MTFTQTGIQTWLIGLMSYSIPMIVFLYAVLTTKPVPTACPRCDGDVPPTVRKCPQCGSLVPNQDQPL